MAAATLLQMAQGKLWLWQDILQIIQLSAAVVLWDQASLVWCVFWGNCKALALLCQRAVTSGGLGDDPVKMPRFMLKGSQQGQQRAFCNVPVHNHRKAQWIRQVRPCLFQFIFHAVLYCKRLSEDCL